MKQSSLSASRSLNKRLMQNFPTHPSKPNNQPIIQYFASKKPNQSASPARNQKEAATDRIPGAPDEFFYDPLQTEMEIDDAEDDVSASLASKQDASQHSDENQSSALESSGILHPVIQRNVNSDQTFASSKEDTQIREELQDSQQQAESEYQQQDMEDQQRQPSGNPSNQRRAIRRRESLKILIVRYTGEAVASVELI